MNYLKLGKASKKGHVYYADGIFSTCFYKKIVNPNYFESGRRKIIKIGLPQNAIKILMKYPALKYFKN